LQLTVRELQQLASEVDDLHHQQMRHFAAEAADLHLDAARASRRRFLKRAGVGGAALAIAPSLLPGRRGLFVNSASAMQSLTDEQIAGYAQGIELAAVAAYTAGAGLLTPEVLPVGQLFLSHHQAHADAFGSVAGASAATEPNAKLLAALGPVLEGLETQEDVLAFAQTVENQATYTYAAALSLLQGADYAAATATILPIEAMHATVLGLALGQDPADQFPTGAFETTELGDGTDPKAGLDPATFA
jgi:hypothetical protein